MAKHRTTLYFGAAATLGALAAAAGYSGITSQASNDASRKFTPVVVVSEDVTFGTRLDANLLRVVPYPKESVPSGAFSSIDSVVGHVTKVFLGAREPATTTKLSSRGGGLSMLVRPAMRATSLEVNPVSGVSGFVLPGDQVDVLVTVTDPGPKREAYTRTILQKVEVLAAGQKTEQQDNKPVTVQSVTLLVDPGQAETLALAQNQGKIHLILRNPEDRELREVAGVSTGEMLGRATPPPPTPKRSTPERRARAVPVAAPAPAQSRNEERPMIRIIRDAKISEVASPNDSL